MIFNLFKLNAEREEVSNALSFCKNVTRSNPRDKSDNVLALDDVVIYNGFRYRIVAMSHRGRVAIRHVCVKAGNSARWVDAKEVSFLTSEEAF